MSGSRVWALELHESKGRATEMPRDPGLAASDDAELRVIIGLDFGTATTKVVLRTPDEYDNRAAVVPFDPAPTAPAGGYLLCTRVYIAADGCASLSPGDDSVPWSDLKEPYLDTSIAASDGELEAWRTTAFIALVIRHTRAWFFAARPFWAGRPILWSLHLGMPTTDKQSKELKPRLQDMAECAWRVANEDCAVDWATIHRIAASRATAAPEDRSRGCYVRIFPELLAAAHGFIQSKSGGPGLYVLVDVGAGTLDVCTFRYHEPEEGEHRYPILEGRVERTGTDRLQKLRTEALEKIGITHPRCSREEDVLNCTSLASIVCNDRRLEAIDAINSADVRLTVEATMQVSRVCATTHMERDYSEGAWSVGLRVFMCGGGRGIPAYRDAVRSGSKLVERARLGVAPLRIIEDALLAPQDLADDVPPHIWPRIIVASGLSDTEFNIGFAIDSTDIENVCAARMPAKVTDYIDK